jgi:hypothetical protein
MGKASNRKKISIVLGSALSYKGQTVYRKEGVNPDHCPLVAKAIRAIFQDDIKKAKSHVEALERHGVSIFEFSMGFDNISFGVPQCVCSWALCMAARRSLTWLIQKAVDKGCSTELPFFRWLIYEIEACATDSVEFSGIEFAATAFVASFVAGRPQKILDTMPPNIGPRIRAITINEVHRELARLSQIELKACIPDTKPQVEGQSSSGKKATAAGPLRM